MRPPAFISATCLSIVIVFSTCLSSCFLTPPIITSMERRDAVTQERDIEEAIAQLTAPNEAARATAAQRLVDRGETAIPFLFRAVAGNDKPLQIEAVKILPRMNDPRTVDFLVATARQAPYPEVRAEIVAALGKIGDASAVPGLLLLAESETIFHVRLRLAKTFGELRDRRVGDTLVRWTTDESPALRRQAIRSLGAIADEGSVVPLINAWRRLSGHEHLDDQSAIATALGNIKSPASVDELLMQLAGSPSIRVRAACARSLGEIGDRRALDGLIAALLDPTETVSRAAREALGAMTGLNHDMQGSTYEDARRKTHDAWMQWRKDRE